MLNLKIIKRILMIKNKVAIITGASSGIGFATALALSKVGAKVAIGARRTDLLSELEKKLKKMAEKFIPKNWMLQRKTNVILLLIMC
ncbi:uncharacterized oxidoreductase Lmo0432 [Nitrosarchaeum sp.]|nr:uncharacterized oxidoreductase Lmo0432 [Nitrosarchaeum sp.]